LRASQQNGALDFSLGSGTDISACPRNVCFTPINGHGVNRRVQKVAHRLKIAATQGFSLRYRLLGESREGQE